MKSIGLRSLRFIKCCQLLVCVLMLTGCSKKPQVADIIIRGGTIYTSDEKNPLVAAVAVAGDTILFAGSEAQANAFKGDSTREIDLKGATMTAGFIESHGHLMALGFSEMVLDLTTVKNYEELVELVRKAAATAKPGQWILGRGWHQEKWDRKPPKVVKGFQTHELLSKASPDNPVFLYHASGHAGFANAKAMQIAGINQLVMEKYSVNPESSGEIIRDELGNPTGIFNERAQDVIQSHITAPEADQRQKALDLAQAACARNGVTSFHDAGMDRSTLELLRKNRKGNKLYVRLYEMLTGFDQELLKEWYAHGPEIDPKHWLTIRSIKLNCDGALGSRGAWLLEEYSDRRGHFGNETLPMDVVLSTSREALKSGFQVCSHAIGDRTNREVLDRYEKAFAENPDKAANSRFRIEHVQHLSPSDIPRFARLGVIASMQTVHLSSDRAWAIDRLGEKRITEGAYMWQSLLRSGAKVINGTDVPVEPINPVASFYSAISRKSLKGEPEGGYEPAEKMTREQALKASTLDAAYGAFEENIKGSIMKGKLADFTIFSQDMMTVPEDKIMKTEITMTIVGGKVVYQK